MSSQLYVWDSYITVGDPLQIAQFTACRAMHRVPTSIVKKTNNFVKFPNNVNAQRIKEEIFQIVQYTGLIRCVDGTHVWIISSH